MAKLLQILCLLTIAFTARNFDDKFHKKKQDVQEKHSLKIQDPYEEKQARFDSYFVKPKAVEEGETEKQSSLEKLEKAYEAMSLKRQRFEAYFKKEQQAAQRCRWPNDPMARTNVLRKNDLNVRALYANIKREMKNLNFSSEFDLATAPSPAVTAHEVPLLVSNRAIQGAYDNYTLVSLDENLESTNFSFGGINYVRDENEQRFLELLKQKQGQATQIDDAVKEIFPEDPCSHLSKIHDWVRIYEQHNPEDLVTGLEIEYYPQ